MKSPIKQFQDASLSLMRRFVEYAVSRNRATGKRYRKTLISKSDNDINKLETRIADLEKDKKMFQSLLGLRVCPRTLYLSTANHTA